MVVQASQGLENLTNLVTKYGKHLLWKDECLSQSKVICMTTVKSFSSSQALPIYMNSFIGWSYKTFSNPKLHLKNSMILQSFWVVWSNSHQLNNDLYSCRQTHVPCLKTCASFRIPNIIFPFLFFSSPFLPFEHKQNPKHIASSPLMKMKAKRSHKNKTSLHLFL